MLLYETCFSNTIGPYASISPIYCGMAQTEPGHVYGSFRRKHFVFQYVLSGKGTFVSPYGTYTPKKDDIFVMHKGDLVDYTSDEADPWKYIWIEFDCFDALPPIFDCGILKGNETVRNYFLEILKLNDLKSGQKAYACSILYRILSALETDSTPPVRKLYSRYINQALKMIHAHYIRKLTVNEIADALNLNRSYFCVRFKKEVGVGVKEYIDEYRIEAAKGMLLQSDATITEIAASAGYSDSSSFIKQFHRKVGCSPTAFRRQQKQQFGW